MAWQVWSIVPIWVAALIGAVLVGALAGEDFLEWLPVVLAVAVLASLGTQLAIQRKEGLVTRLIASAGGALVVVAIATGVLAVIHPAVSPFAQ